MVQSINNQFPVVPKYDNQAVKTTNNQIKQPSNTSIIMDSVTISHSSETAITYSSSKISTDEMADKSYEMLRQLVTNMLKEQGIDFKIATDSSEIDISEISQEEAQELIAEDGYFGVEQTSDRIVDFALAAAGGDVSKLDVIKEGVENGFSEALDAFGGWLPDISYDTLDAVMEKLDAWAEQSKGN